MMAENKSYQDEYFQDIQAGGFKKRSLLDRLNPFTPFSSKKFVPTAKGQEFLDKFKKDTGKNLVVLPIEQKGIDAIKKDFDFTPSGYFKTDAFRGGSRDPFTRYAYLDPKNPSLYTLVHEGGHAQDKNLTYDPYQRDRRIAARRGRHTIKSPSSFEEYLEKSGKGIMSTFGKELTAETYARDYFKDKNLLRPSEQMALNYEIEKDKPFPYESYERYKTNMYPTQYPLSFLEKFLKDRDDSFNINKGDEGLTSAAIRGRQKEYDEYLESDFRRKAYENYLNPAYEKIKSLGMDVENAQRLMNFRLGL